MLVLFSWGILCIHDVFVAVGFPQLSGRGALLCIRAKRVLDGALPNDLYMLSLDSS